MEREPAGQDRRTRKRRERRDQVYECAIELFVERGYDSTTMDDIAGRADVARATVFNHFERKAAILDEWASRRRRRAFESVRAEDLDDHDVGEILARYTKELARISAETRDETVALMSAAGHSANLSAAPALGHDLAGYLSAGRDRGQLRADVDPVQAGLLLASGYFLVLNRWIAAEPAPFDLYGELLKTLDLVLFGVLAEGDR